MRILLVAEGDAHGHPLANASTLARQPRGSPQTQVQHVLRVLLLRRFAKGPRFLNRALVRPDVADTWAVAC